MSFSDFLESRRESAKALVKALQSHFSYVSVLGVDVKAKAIRVNKNTAGISAGRDTECGFVVKMSNGKVFFEYSLDDIAGDIVALSDTIFAAFQLHESLAENTVGNVCLPDEPLKQSFSRSSDLHQFTDDQILAFCGKLKDELLAKSEHLLNAMVAVSTLETSKLFISPNRELDQNYTWINGTMVAVYRENDKVVQTHEGASSLQPSTSTSRR